MTGQTFSERIEAACRANAQRTAIYEVTGAPVRFANFFFTVLAFAEALADRGVRQGQLVGVYVQDAIAGTALRLALIRIGAVAVSAAPEVLAGRGVALDWRLVVAAAVPRDPREIVVDGSWIRSPRRVVPATGRGGVIVATSGTTGVPKLRLFSETLLLVRLERKRAHRGDGGQVAYVGYNAAASPGFQAFVQHLLSGTPQLHALATPRESLAEIARFGVTTAYLPPSGFLALLEAAEALGRAPEQLRRIVVGGGALSPQQAALGEKVFGCEIINTYGSAETGSIAHHRPALTPDMPGIVGPVYADLQTRFIGEDGREQPAATGGELWLRMPEALRLRDFPSGTPLCDPDGWIATGDVGKVMPDGALVLTGRKSELLNVGGNKAAPSRFEKIAQVFPGLADVAAFRAPSGSGMDHVGLAVVAGQGFDRAAFEAYMAGQLGPLYPLHVVIVDQLPMSASGKIDRAALTNSVAERVAGSPGLNT